MESNKHFTVETLTLKNILIVNVKYPRTANGVSKILVEVEDTRVIEPLLLEFDFETNKWSIKMEAFAETSEVEGKEPLEFSEQLKLWETVACIENKPLQPPKYNYYGEKL